jgi:hypothetical protein
MLLSERLWAHVPAQLFILDGGSDGKITLLSTSGFKVKQNVTLKAIGQPNLLVQVKRVLNSTTLFVGPITSDINSRLDISNYTVLLGATIEAGFQSRINITNTDITRACYDEEPTLAHRNVLVDEFGKYYNSTNSFPVSLSSGSISIGNVRLSAHDDDPTAGLIHSSIRIGDGNYELKINPDQSINVTVTNPTPAITGFATEAKQDIGNASLSSIDGKLTTVNSNLVTIQNKQDTGNSSLSSIDGKLTTIENKQDTGNNSLSSIDSKLTTIENKQDTGNSSLSSIDTKLDTVNTNLVTIQNKEDTANSSLASIDSKLDGIAFNDNIRQKILASADRIQDIYYADFGNKNQRIIRIDYNSPTIGLTIARKTLNYTLSGNLYRRDSIIWTIV